MTTIIEDPAPIGPIHFSQPRAQPVRQRGNLTEFHSAVYGSISVYVDTQEEANAIIAAWPEFMQLAANRASEILDAIRASNPPAEGTQVT